MTSLSSDFSLITEDAAAPPSLSAEPVDLTSSGYKWKKIYKNTLGLTLEFNSFESPKNPLDVSQPVSWFWMILICICLGQKKSYDLVSSDCGLEPLSPIWGASTSSTARGQVLKLLLLQPIRAWLYPYRQQPIGCAGEKVSECIWIWWCNWIYLCCYYMLVFMMWQIFNKSSSTVVSFITAKCLLWLSWFSSAKLFQC